MTTQTGNLQTTRGTIIKHTVAEKTGAKGPYKHHEFTLNTGKTFKLFGTMKSDLPSLDKKDIQGLVEGADVVVAESQNGKYLNVIGVDVLPSQTGNLVSGFVNTTTREVVQVTPPQVSSKTETTQKPSDRDASIVIQAITKSLLEGAGNQYVTQVEKNGASFLNINTGALEQHIKKILEVHDKLVLERAGN